jgi:hypothetical protein
MLRPMALIDLEAASFAKNANVICADEPAMAT